MDTIDNATSENAAERKPDEGASAPAYKIRFNEEVSVKDINGTLDAIDAMGGYCPCQVPSEDTKCHCKDFLQNKKIGEPCICNIYVKQAK